MQEQKQEEPSVVVDSDALVDPNAVVIKLFDAFVAHSAVLRPRWLFQFASCANLTCWVHEVIKWKLGLGTTNVFLVLNVTWVVGASPIEAVVTDNHKH